MIAGEGGGGEAHLIFGQLVGVLEIKLVARPDHERHAIFVQAEDAAIASPR